MANQAFYPTREGDQLTWFTNIQSKIATYYTPLDITPARQAKLTLTLDWLQWTWGTFLPSRRQDAPAATAWRNQLATGTSDTGTAVSPPVPATLTPPAGTPYFGMLIWLFEEIGRWKSAEGYTDTIGQSLGIIGATQAGPDLVTIQPAITATASGGTVRIAWGWQGYSAFLDLCELCVDRADGKNFVPLAYDTTPNYEDTAPYPAAPTRWTYRAIYRVGDHQVGQWSADVSVTVGG
ncbi:MAG: hypothetical protein ACRCXD_12705 [Luteolibacter sp.]